MEIKDLSVNMLLEKNKADKKITNVNKQYL